MIAEAFEQHGLWDEQDGFYYDQLLSPEGERVPIRARSFVGLMPLVATAVLDEEVLRGLPSFAERLDTFLRKRPDLATCVDQVNERGQRLMSVVNEERLARILARVVDPAEFWSGHGIRSLSKAHLADPVRVDVGGVSAAADYEPAESSTRLYGGNSNWRGPIWMPANLSARRRAAPARPLPRRDRAGRAGRRVLALDAGRAPRCRPGRAVPPRPRRRAPDQRSAAAAGRGPALERADVVQRVLPRGLRRRARRRAPDRLDRLRRRPPAADPAAPECAPTRAGKPAQRPPSGQVSPHCPPSWRTWR